MAAGADDEGLSAPFGHELVPYGLRSPRSFEIGKLADMVGFHDAGLLAQLAPCRLEPGDQFFSADGDRGRDAVGEDRVFLAP